MLATTLEERFASAETLSAYLETVDANRDLWHSIYRRAVAPDWAKTAAGTLAGKVKLLVLLEDWCTDGLGSIPALAALADAMSDKLELRVLRRDSNLDLMDAHLSPTGGRSIPVVILLDEDGGEFAWWGSRPAALQAWFEANGKAMEMEDRIRYARTWYAKDRGESTLREVLAVAGAVLPAGEEA